MTPTLSGRIQTRLVLLALVGAPWTVVITPVLPRPEWVALSMLYDIMFRGLALVGLIGLGWELLYHGVQQLRWDKDWPSLLQLMVMVNEAVVVWLVLHVTQTIPGTVAISAPLMPAYSIFFASTWTLIWLVMHGPLRVFALRWRFEGARLVPRHVRVIAEPLAGLVPARTGRVAPDQHPPDPQDSEAALTGVRCAHGHFNHADLPFCAHCGLSLRQRRSGTVTGPRPPLGTVILDDGRPVPLDGDYVVGAAPHQDLLVRRGAAKPLALSDPAGEIADSHFEIRLRGWDVELCDRGSRTGTQVAVRDSRRWRRLTPGLPTAVGRGTRVRIGGHVITVESHLPLRDGIEDVESDVAAGARQDTDG